MQLYSKVPILVRLQVTDVGRGCAIRRLLSSFYSSCFAPLFSLINQFCVALITFLYPWLKRIQMLEVGIHFTLGLGEERLDGLVKNAGMCSKVGEDEVGMSEQQEIGLFVIALVFVDLCLLLNVSFF